MKSLKISLLLLLLPLAQCFAQVDIADSLVSEIQSKTHYFYSLQGDITYEEGVLTLNSMKIDLKNTDIGYQITEDEEDHILYFISTDGSDSFEFQQDGETMFTTDNVVHLIRTDEQAIELVVLFTLLKSISPA
ncbi:hypothetical protein R9C00_19190 [Flammeovirgaceae bacterium SG7u.111]|nr:hypothetical protein [Flammeovirgaceae bacterium SG7u.132]WPO33826.1 hypothetical protein R9C00_19190 [Flammeovirgaceae bacterium SG7u.111]